jgi:hypothetical protein
MQISTWNSVSRAGAVVIAVLAAVIPVRAHHGAAAYDLAKPVTLKATITAFDWQNPHALIGFTAAGPDGAAEAWTAETAGPVILVRAGWTKTTLQPGDRVTIVGQQARNGSRTMLLQRIILADGRELTSFIPR